MFTLDMAKKKLAQYGQEHVLYYYDELNDKEKTVLLQQINELDFSIIDNIYHQNETKRGIFEPLKAKDLKEIADNHDLYYKIGIDALKKGKCAACLLAGGMGTRLGSKDPKGMYDIGITSNVYIFQRLIENILRNVAELGVYPYLFIMTSDKNNDATTAFLAEKNYFNYPGDKVIFFIQDNAVACDYNGKVFLEDKGHIATSPNGNAGWYYSMQKAGLDKLLAEKNIEWINVFAVDNVLQNILDPVFIGACINAGVECGSKVVAKKDRNEKVGVMCLEDNHPSIVEYYELSDEMKDAKDADGKFLYNYGVILNYLFSIKALKRIADKKLPLHVVEKKIAYLAENGEFIKPTEPNGYKFEQLVLDMIHALDSCLPFEVERAKEFAPIKNKTGVDSIESARILLARQGIKL